MLASVQDVKCEVSVEEEDDGSMRGREEVHRGSEKAHGSAQ